MSATRKLAEFVCGLAYDDISQDAIAKAKLCVLDWVGVTAGGYLDGSGDMDIMLEALSPFFGQSQATLITRKKKVDVINAALVNGTASHLLDYDDVHMGMIGHPSVPLIPAALAIAEHRGIGGKRLIEAIVAGVEAECRIGEAVNPEHYSAGWHATATLGCFGACAAVARLIGLDADKVVSALGIAGTQASGLRQSFGTMCKPFHAGRAASNGLLAAILAEKGFTAPQQILEGEAGFSKVLSQRFDEPKMDSLGRPFEIEGVVYKRYSSCYLTHPTVRCILRIKDKYQPAASKITSLEVRASAASVTVAGKLEPKTGLEGKFSLRYCAALALLKGRAVESDFTDEAVNGPEVREMMSKTSVVQAESLLPTEAEIKIKLNDGREVNEKLELASEDTAVSVDEWESTLVAKSGDFLERAFSSEKSAKIISSIRELEKIDNVREVVELMS
ncbi:MAG: MmgE/PrpD family protein [Chloroflexi bacterium]|nr:MmgE/PrpD family protein [Chloroflexota bacterium]MBM4454493.1 MmgE/PrpD family protein [Chloroflexota bacterium]